MAREIDWRDLPKVMAVSAKGIKGAGANTLNDVAFKALPELVRRAEGDMNFRGNARRALGWRIERATVATMQATVYTDRGWFGLHAKEGDRRASSSRIMVGGRQMLFIPRQKGAGVIDKRGRIRTAAWRGIYFIPKGDHALVFYRARKGAKDSELVGVAVQEAKFHKDTDWDGVISQVWDDNVAKLMKRRLEDRAAFEAGWG